MAGFALMRRGRILVLPLAGGGAALAFSPALSPALWPVFFCFGFALLALVFDALARARRGGYSSARQFFLAGWLFCFVYFFTSLLWIAEAFALDPATAPAALPALLALAFALAVLQAAPLTLAGWLWPDDGAPKRFLLFAALWLAGELLRGLAFSGFPWNLAAQPAAGFLPLAQNVSWLGAYGLGALFVLAAQTPAQFFAAKTRAAPFAAGLILLALLTGFGFWRLNFPPPQISMAAVQLALIQPAIAQRDKWDRSKSGENLALTFALTARAIQEVQPDIIIWPESALPFVMTGALPPPVKKPLASLLPPDSFLIAGVLRRGGERRIYNSLRVFDGQARIIATYDKRHLVPFGEYLPFRPLLRALGLRAIAARGDIASGETRPLLQLADWPVFAPLICYEVIFAEEVPGITPGTTNSAPSSRARWLVNITNDAWYGASAGPFQHYAQARLRAIEQGLPLARAANTGISAVLTPLGQERAFAPLEQRTYLTAILPPAIRPPLFARFGLLIPFALLLILAFASSPWLNRLNRLNRLKWPKARLS